MQYDYVNFKMNRNITTIYDAWKEWNYGSTTADNIFIPPLRDIEAQLGSKWRGGFSTVEGNFFSRRKSLLDVMQIMMTEGIPEEEAIQILDEVAKEKKLKYIRQTCDYLHIILKNYSNDTSSGTITTMFK
jgi:hypothetical protein